MANLHEELDQEKKKYTMVEIKLRNAERAKDDAEKRNEMLQKEMEQFFSTFGDLTADPPRPDRANTIWIQWAVNGLPLTLHCVGLCSDRTGLNQTSRHLCTFGAKVRHGWAKPIEPNFQNWTWTSCWIEPVGFMKRDDAAWMLKWNQKKAILTWERMIRGTLDSCGWMWENESNYMNEHWVLDDGKLLKDDRSTNVTPDSSCDRTKCVLELSCILLCI